MISGSGAVTVNGSGSLTLNAANSYTGKTTIASGSTLLLGSSGSLASTNIYLASGTLDVSAVASPSLGSTETLSGSGAVNAGSGTLTVNGNITPLVGGNNGLISLTGGLTLAGSSTTTLELTSATTAGSTYDAISASGVLTYNGLLDIVINGAPSYGTYDLFSGGSFSGNFTNVILTGTWDTGTFTNTGSAWSFTDTGGSNNITFTQGSGDAVISLVPEPSSLVLMGLGMFTALLVGRKIRRKSA